MSSIAAQTVVGRDADRLAELDLDGHDVAGSPPRSSTAACSGGDGVHEHPGALLEPGDDAERGGARRRASGTRRPAGRWRGAEDHVVRRVAERPAQRGERVAQPDAPPRAISASVASSIRARVERCATRIPYGAQARTAPTRARDRRRRSGPSRPGVGQLAGRRGRRGRRSAASDASTACGRGRARRSARAGARSTHPRPCPGSRTPARTVAGREVAPAPGRGSP